MQEKLDAALFNATGLGNLDLVKEGIKAGGNPATKQNGARSRCVVAGGRTEVARRGVAVAVAAVAAAGGAA